jgi:hypothetical protein
VSLELIYTSASRGLVTASGGFCTVAATAGTSRQVTAKLEGLSGYQFHFGLSDPRAAQNPVNFAHTRVRIGAETLSVLSRVAFCGADYSGRTNKIAHHFLLERGEEMPNGPAWMIMAMARGLFVAGWNSEPQDLPKRALRGIIATEPRPAEPARTWHAATGDAGWAGVLVQAFRENPKVPAFVIFKPGTDLLPLFEESLALLPPEERWQVGFATYYTALPAGCQYHWRGVLAGSAAAKEIARFPNAVVIDLTAPLGQAAGNEYTDAARTGRTLAPPQAAERPRIRIVDRERAVANAVASAPPAEEKEDFAPWALEPAAIAPNLDSSSRSPSPAQLQALMKRARRARWVPVLLVGSVLLAMTNLAFLMLYVLRPLAVSQPAPDSTTSADRPETQVGAAKGREHDPEKAAPGQNQTNGAKDATGSRGLPVGKVADNADLPASKPSEKTVTKPPGAPEHLPKKEDEKPQEEAGANPANTVPQESPAKPASKPGQDDAEKRPLPQVETALANRENLKSYTFKTAKDPERKPKGTMQWRVGKANAFVEPPSGLGRLRIAPKEDKSGAMVVSGLSKSGNWVPLAELTLNDGSGERELALHMIEETNSDLRRELDYLVIEVVDNEQRSVVQCEVAKQSQVKRRITLGYSAQGPNLGKPMTLATQEFYHPWPSSLRVAEAETPGMRVGISLAESQSRATFSVTVQLDKVPPTSEIIAVMRPSLEKKSNLANALQAAKSKRDNAKTQLDKEIRTRLIDVDSRDRVTEEGKLNKLRDDKLAPLNKEVTKIEGNISKHNSEVQTAREEAQRLMNPTKDMLTKSKPISVLDAWGRVIAVVELEFSSCNPEDVKVP